MWKEERGDAAGEGVEVRVDMESMSRGNDPRVPRRVSANPSLSSRNSGALYEGERV